MRTIQSVISVIAGTFACFPVVAGGWEKAEHRQLGERAFAQILHNCQVSDGDSLVFIFNSNCSIKISSRFWENQNFGELCASFSGNDRSRARFQESGRTILQQLQSLKAAAVEEVWGGLERQNSSANGVSGRPAERSRGNVVANYLLHHLMALRFARLAGTKKIGPEVALTRALVYEAIAQTYLADAFSSGHLLVPLNDPFYVLHSRNNQEAHDFYCSEGVFVMNSKGEVWQTFGDRLLRWYAPSYEHVLQACHTSLCELFFVLYVLADSKIPEALEKWSRPFTKDSPKAVVKTWLANHEGGKYYSEVRLPTLLLLPMPVSATWSVKNEKDDNPRNNHRKHFPQLFEKGFHDPELENFARNFLYRKEHVPDWMIPEELSQKNPQKLIKSHPDFASVRYFQKSSFSPSYVGLLLSTHAGAVFMKKGKGRGLSFGLGYGLIDDFLLFNKASFDIALTPGLDEPGRLLLGPTFGYGIKVSLHRVEAVRIETGYAWGLRSPFKSKGFQLALGLESETISLGFTYIGVTFRLNYRWFWVEQTKQGLFLEAVLH